MPMFQLNGTLKKDEVRDFKKKDGSECKKRVVYIEPVDSIFPIEVNIEDFDLKLGKIGDPVTINLSIYPYYFENGTRKRASLSYYVPLK